ncbi:MFS transporter [methane-oxidizing endosymbiont of Gigantopelta aegis]|uniref:MFS transporter n=1 Tax=methane-oxidizing endosymbiont of Gigantopelta aegis TaxID=2794938 RepID=UPI0018DBA181|nr:MFS transporter [methane-oxidizing endosymbiont of Gigantopelta aegis]
MADKPVTAIPRTIWALGFVSLFMDLSSELIHSLLPVFLVSTLGASALTVGVIEGIAEATAHIVKVFSGSISDFFGRRKLLLLIGYGLAALSKPLFPMADSVFTVFTARFLDRIGKGIRGAPRDALIADVAPAKIRGACFGLRQSLDTIGAFLGPLAAMLLLFLLHGDMTAVLWFAVIPSALAVLLILLAVDEPTLHTPRQISNSPLCWHSLKQFSVHYWWVILIGIFFTLARFSEAFLVLRAQQNGLSINWIPAIMVIMSLAYALSAYPVGRLSDRINKKWLLGISLLWLIISDIVLALAHGELSIPMLFIGVACWGLHMGFSQGTLATLIAETTPLHLKGTAFGLFNFISGIFMLLASLIAGGLWTYYGAEFTFYCGAGFALLAMLVLVVESRIKNTG